MRSVSWDRDSSHGHHGWLVKENKGFWAKVVRPVLERPPESVANKVQDVHNKGLPDVDYCVRGVSGKLELKYVASWPVRATTQIKIDVSKEQRMQLRRWHNAGGQCYVLLGVQRNWYLLPWDVPEALTRIELQQQALTLGTFDDLSRLTEYLRFGHLQTLGR